MDELDRRSDALLPLLTRVPPRGPGVCFVCHGPPRGEHDSMWCDTCDRTIEALKEPLTSGIAPITLYWQDESTYSPIYDTLKQYKWRPANKAAQWDMASLVSRFLRDHGRCIGFDERTRLVVVPSCSDKRQGEPHPLDVTLRRTKFLHRAMAAPSLEFTGAQLEKHEASDDRYRTTRDVSGERVLLIDDLWATGSRLQSAASRLRLEGAKVIGGVVVGRQVKPRWNDHAAQFWQHATAAPFSFDRCCVESSA